MVDYSDDDSASGGGGKRYSYSFSPGKSHHDAESDAEDDVNYSYSNAVSAALKSPTNGSSATSDDSHSEKYRGARFDHELDDVEETIEFDRPSHERSGTQRANQEYYDVLEMASNRLRQDNFVIGGDESSGDEAVRPKKKKKKKSKKEKRKGQMTFEDDEENADASRRSAVFKSFIPPSMMISHGGVRKSFKSAITKDDLAAIGYGDTVKETDIDPNDDLPIYWNPAALVTASQSRLSDGRIDKHGFYTNMKVRAGSAYGKVQTLVKGNQDQIDNNFNLHSIGKSQKKTYTPLGKLDDSIVWGDDETVTDRKGGGAGAGREGGGARGDREADGIEMSDTRAAHKADVIEVVDDCSFSELDEVNSNYLINEKLIKKLMWQRDKRRLGIISTVALAIFCIWLGLYLGLAVRSSSHSQSSTVPGDDGIDRSPPPSRPRPPAPIEPIHGFDNGSSSHPITATELRYIVNQITTDPSVLSNPHTPQAKAFEWCKNDIKIYSVDITSRVANRYALATLYYSTNGTKWATNKVKTVQFIMILSAITQPQTSLTLTVISLQFWGNGHECEWYGVGCESGDNNTVSVTYLDLNNNNLVGTIPPEIGWIYTLEQIHLWGNNLVGSIPNTLSQLGNLHTLYLNANYLSGEMGDAFNKLQKLKHLDLSNNRLRGHIPHGLGSLSDLRDLRLSNNLLTSAFPMSLISLSNLETLLLDSNSISGSLPSLVGRMKSLVTIRIHDNDLKGKVPSFVDAKVLEEAHFDGNFFSGTIPNFGSQRLREIYLGRNALTGSIPDIIGSLAKLEIFSASGNKLNSTIPSSISDATQLNILDLSYNKLTGEIPREISNLVLLHEIRLDHNRLRGFPDLGQLKHLEIVHLNNNLLDGKLNLPLDMGDLENLKEFAIQNNDLTGVINEFMCDLLLDVLTSDCWGSPPQVDCPCCTECY
ncbi:hypothetical protein ACHAW5_001070 [Stephanodiscus triporus]|uniref:Disease resistance R13L4/SHOC-2-like LRR domain-containing protein n=1 Tax=Stephanodiscus triporus TaxID=2934178 RepID=A0ABD3QKF3_9STRA